MPQGGRSNVQRGSCSCLFTAKGQNSGRPAARFQPLGCPGKPASGRDFWSYVALPWPRTHSISDEETWWEDGWDRGGGTV